jgi:hypothetical protein
MSSHFPKIADPLALIQAFAPVPQSAQDAKAKQDLDQPKPGSGAI